MIFKTKFQILIDMNVCLCEPTRPIWNKWMILKMIPIISIVTTKKNNNNNKSVCVLLILWLIKNHKLQKQTKKQNALC